MVINRTRIERLFDFSYSLECYLPQGKRKYGYFTLPILWGERFAGRIDPKAERKNKTLIIRSVILEPGFKEVDALLPALKEKLLLMARFNGCEKIVVKRTLPVKIKPLLRV